MSIDSMRDDRDYIQSLLLEKITGTISESDNRVIEELLVHDETTQLLWVNISTKINSPEGQNFLKNLDENNAWEEIEEKIRPEARLLRPPQIRRAYWLAAAAVVIAIGVNFFHLSKDRSADQNENQKSIHLRLADGKTIALDENTDEDINLGPVRFRGGKNGLSFSSNKSGGLQWTTLVVPLTKDYKITLADGSEVWMNASSSLRFPLNFTDSIREVHMTGEGYFKVAEKADQPFIVHAGNTSIRVLGTSFNVNAYDDSLVSTALVEGSVMAKAGEHEILLKPGYQTLAKGRNAFVTKPFDRDLVLSWLDGTYHFHEQSLTEISKVMKRWFNITVVLESAEASALRFTGTIYKNQGPDVFISNLELSSNIQATLSRDTLYLR